MTFKSFEEFDCWQDARALDNSVFKLTVKNGFERDFKLRDQILGATGSIMDNVAEGFGRSGNREFVRFLTYSKGSSDEVKSQLYRALDRAYISKSEFDINYNDADIVSKKIGGLIKYLNNSEFKGPRFKTNESKSNKSKIQNPELRTRNPEPETRNPEQ
jgi:four helix bundle protein